jgi:GTPase SAR1 family protein
MTRVFFSLNLKIYYKQAVAAIIVYDLTNPESLEDAVKIWKKDVDENVFLKNNTPIPCLLIGNKCDLSNKMNKSEEEMKKFCQQHNFINWFETSSFSGENIDEAIDCLIKKILETQADEGEEVSDQKNEVTKIIPAGNESSVKLTSTICCG